MKKIILLLLLVTSCGMYNSDGVYVNKYNTQVQFDSITGQYVLQLDKYQRQSAFQQPIPIPMDSRQHDNNIYNHFTEWFV